MKEIILLISIYFFINEVQASTKSNIISNLKKIDNSDFKIKADLVLLAMGFVHPIHEGLLKQIGVTLNERGNVQANDDDYMTSIDKIFVAGDMRRGQSLVVWAIREGRQVAHSVDKFLMGHTKLPR